MAISLTQPKVEAKKIEVSQAKLPALSFHFGKPVKTKELMLFTSQISLMLETGNSLNRTLEIMAVQINNPYFREVILKTISQIESGQLFSEALNKYPKVFSSLFISAVKVGETGGFLKQMMKQLAEYYQQREEYISAIRKALIYPLVLMVFSFLVVCFVIVYVFPRLATFLEGKEALLPKTTLFFMWLSHFIRQSWPFLLLGLPTLAVLIRLLLKREDIASFLEYQRFKIPLLKIFLIKFYTSYFFSNLGFLLTGGVPLLEALKVSRSIMSSSVYRRLIQEIIESVEKGGGFSPPLRKSSFLPMAVREMVQTGEDTGNLHQVILRLGEYYAQEFKKGMELTCSILEPMIIIMMGGVVGAIVISIIIPIFRLSSGVY